MSPWRRKFQQAQQATSEEVFMLDERHLHAAFARHLRCARTLLGDPELVPEAEFHVLMAVECLFKHLFCLVRYSLGVRANVPEDFCEVTYVKEFGHKVWRLGGVLISDPDLRGYSPLQQLMTLLPADVEWNEGRYRTPQSQTLDAKVREMLALVEQIDREVLGERHAG